MQKTLILIAVIIFIIVVVCILTGVWNAISHTWQFYAFGGIVSGYLILAAALTDGGRQSMDWRDWAILIFVTISWVAVTVCVILTRKLVKCSPWYLADLQERYKQLEASYIKLQADYGALQGRSDMTATYLAQAVEKHRVADVVTVDAVNHEFVSRDGMSRKEKQRRAAELYAAGWSKEDIAEDLGIAVGTVSTYISAGNRIVFGTYAHGLDPDYDHNRKAYAKETRKRNLSKRASQEPPENDSEEMAGE